MVVDEELNKNHNALAFAYTAFTVLAPDGVDIVANEISDHSTRSEAAHENEPRLAVPSYHFGEVV